ncbi:MULTISPECIES: phage tail protein [Haloferax]|uniref:T4-like virus tail tube protein gp19 n=1 Tax=Haloferax massiliensis TaxID=1476858 RepID=A0A0D6JVA2_9EURY|nr:MULTISPECIES: phage tail protein [Haloferax]MDS0241693.1 phage tail protein [Haloferax sp. S2CR25]MDS0444814.1 phage tail protein [Haloferax sp. S2CR25-2]CQR52258.1 T4-like virus tail tube protein gp19 [Haloferax massiliensis]
MTAAESDPYGAHRFRVRCDALPKLGFSEVRGLSVAVESANGDDSGSESQSPGADGRGRRARKRPTPRPRPPSSSRRATSSPPLELRRGVTDDRSLWAWFRAWVDGEATPQDVRICLLDATGDPVRGWVCRAATPVRWTGPHLVADAATVATESLELTHEGIDAVTDLDDCDD